MKLRRPFDVPVQITQGFGPTEYTGEPSLYGYAHFHCGVDYAMATGTPILASGPGVVTTAHWDVTGFGWYVEITHDNGIVSGYGHLSKILAFRGERVAEGQKVAESGSSGNSTGPHLHWRTRLGAWDVPPAVLVY